jgi:hypothetical protein
LKALFFENLNEFRQHLNVQGKENIHTHIMKLMYYNHIKEYATSKAIIDKLAMHKENSVKRLCVLLISGFLRL